MQERNKEGQFIKGSKPWSTGLKIPYKPRPSMKGRTPWNRGLKIGNGGRVGKKSHSWKGGKTVYSYGYVKEIRIGHPRADKDGYVPIQWLVAEEFLGRPLKKGEVVHHIDGDRANNEPSNLYVFSSNSEHMKFERKIQLGSVDRFNLIGLDK